MYFIYEALKNINIKNIIWLSSKEFNIVNGELKIINNVNGNYVCNNKVIKYIKYSIAEKYYDSKNLMNYDENNFTYWKLDNYFVCVFNIPNFPSIFIDDNYEFKNYNIDFKFELSSNINDCIPEEDYCNDDFHTLESHIFDKKIHFKYLYKFINSDSVFVPIK